MNKKIKLIITAIIFLAVFAGIFVLAFNKNQNGKYQKVKVEKGNITQTVSVTGKVVPLREISLSFQKNGVVEKIFKDVGDKVKNGEKIAELNSDDVLSKISEAEADLIAQKETLRQMEKGAKKEDIELAKEKIEKAKTELERAKIDFQKEEKKEKAYLNDYYASGASTAQEGLSTVLSAIYTLTDIQYNHFNDNSLESNNLAGAKATVLYLLFGEYNNGRWSNDFISQKDSGLKREIEKLSNNEQESEEILPKLNNLLWQLKSTLGKVLTSKLSSGEKTDLKTAKTNTASEIKSVSTAEQNIAKQKALNQSSLSSYQTVVKKAEKSLSLAEKEYQLTISKATNEEINKQKALIDKAEANLAYYQDQLLKSSIYSPIEGIVSYKGIKEGETAQVGKTAFVVMTNNNLEAEVYVPETDINKISVGNSAKATFDALPNETLYMTVIKIDPAQKIIDGVATYKTTLVFKKESNEIKPGMTVDLEIIGKRKNNVLVIPWATVIRKDDKNFVYSLNKNGVGLKEIRTGIVGENGKVEVVRGLKKNDEIIIPSGDEIDKIVKWKKLLN